jgi:hypothetical protein
MVLFLLILNTIYVFTDDSSLPGIRITMLCQLRYSNGSTDFVHIIFKAENREFIKTTHSFALLFAFGRLVSGQCIFIEMQSSIRSKEYFIEVVLLQVFDLYFMI